MALADGCVVELFWETELVGRPVFGLLVLVVPELLKGEVVAPAVPTILLDAEVDSMFTAFLLR